MASMAEAISTRKLRKVFRSGTLGLGTVLALESLDLEIGEGEVFGLLGPNGSGKSTAIKICLDLIRATSGECRVFGQKTSRVAARRRIGYVPEAPFFYGYLTGRSLVESMGRFSGMTGKALKTRTGDVLETVELDQAADRAIRTYSKGMLQRLGLAQALVHDPDLVILDEPTAGVDPIGSRQITDLIRRLKAEGKTVLLCSHLLSQVETVCDRVAILHRGTMLAEGTMDELQERVEKRSSLIFKSEADLAKGKALLSSAGIEAAPEPRTVRSLEEVFVSLVEGDREEGL